MLKSVTEDLDDNLPIAKAAGEQRTWSRQPIILRRSLAIDAWGTEIRSSHEFLRRSNAKIPIIGDVAYSAAAPFAQISFSIGLQTKRNASKQELLVRRFRFFAKQVPISLLKQGSSNLLTLQSI
jgi:hypothetical protein